MAEPKSNDKVKPEVATKKPAPAVSVTDSRKRLYRSCKDKVLGGVAGGLGEYFDIDPAIIRLALVLIALAGGTGILAYIVAWVVIPEDPACKQTKAVAKPTPQVAPKVSEGTAQTQDTRRTGSIILLGLGLIFLLQSTFGFDAWDRLWPLIFVIVGLGLLLGSQRS